MKKYRVMVCQEYGGYVYLEAKNAKTAREIVSDLMEAGEIDLMAGTCDSAELVEITSANEQVLGGAELIK